MGFVPKPSDSTPDNGSLNSSVFSSGHCAGLYPVTGNKTYYDGCVGHDEPGVQFYSNLPGSGGNFSWNITLPVGNGPSHNQSNLYVAVWVGMTLNDPLAWMNQCFLEVQLYPDSTYDSLGNSLPSDGRWVGAAVAWQIEAATGYEDPCYYQVLYNNGIPGPSYFNMTQGDRLTFTMNGWATSPYGENLTIVDRTNGLKTNLTLYDPYGKFPLNPSYSTSSFENGLQWTPGGEFPVVFSFELGHTRDPTNPGNPGFNYCTPGPPPNFPCGSYDPASWVNDTRAPWKIGVPTFFGPTGSQVPAEVGFTHDLGGLNLIDSSVGCPGNEGSASCSYPWYSYSCAAHAFEYGATNFPGVTSDFGKYGQFSRTYEVDSAGLAYYPPTNYSIPACERPAFSLALGFSGVPGGSVYFLSHAYGGNATVGALGTGPYAIHAVDRRGARFSSWLVSGNGSVDLPSCAWAGLTLWGNASLTATFVALPPTTNVTFNDSVANASVAVMPSFLLTGLGQPLAKLPSGGTVALADTIYAIYAYPPIGYNFTKWTVSSGGAVVASPGFPDSTFVVTGTATHVTVTAWYTASKAQAYVSIYSYGGGTITFNGTAYNSTVLTVQVGSYPISANPSAGYQFSTWSFGGSNAWVDQRSATNITLETGSSYLYASFALRPVVVTVDVAAPGSGAVSFAPPTVLTNGTNASLSAGSWSPLAVPNSGFAFSHWTVNSSAAAWANPPSSAQPTFQLNSSVTLTAFFVAASLETLHFVVVPAQGGTVGFNLGSYANGTSNSSVSNGSYYLQFLPAPGFGFSNASTTGPATIVGSALRVTGTNGTVRATFVALPLTKVPVTFVAEPANATTAKLNGTSLAQGATLMIVPGTYALRAMGAANTTFLDWSATGGLAVASNGSASTSVTVTGGGAVYAYAIPFVLRSEVLNFSPIDRGNSVQFWAVAAGVGPFNYTWSGRPPGCPPTVTVPVYGDWCTPTQPGTYSIGLNISNPSGANLVLRPKTLIVTPWPSLVSFSATRTLVDIGSTTVLTAYVVGGVGSLTFSYSGLPFGCPSADSGVLVCTPSHAGATTVALQAYDWYGERAYGNLSLTVRPLPSILAFSAAPATVTEGVSTALHVVVLNGVGPYTYTYSGLPAGCADANVSQLNCTPALSGSFVVNVTATDVFGNRAVGQLTLTANPKPAVVSFTASPATFVYGGTTNLTVSAAGGTGLLHYAYAGVPVGCTASDRPRLTCQPGATGTFTVGVAVSDSFGVGTNASVSFQVTTPLPTPIPHPTTVGGGGISSSALLTIVGVAAVVALIGGVAWWRSSRRPPDPEPSDVSADGEAPTDTAPT